jgi:hypothetical protein
MQFKPISSCSDTCPVSVNRISDRVVVTLLSLGLLGSLGPHLAIVGLRVADVRPPAALVFVCPLHQAGVAKPPPAVVAALGDSPRKR